MYLKDYYTILEIRPSADLSQIKQAYRKLAHRYHPDKNNNDPYADARFAEIKEAYEVLTHPQKKEYYLQQRWYQQSTGSRKTATVVTPVTILESALELNRHVSKLDMHRLDREGLKSYILDLVNDDTTDKLKAFNEPSIKQEIANSVISSSRLLTSAQFETIKQQVLKISYNPFTIVQANQLSAELKAKENWHKYQPWLMLVLVILICLMIYFFSI